MIDASIISGQPVPQSTYPSSGLFYTKLLPPCRNNLNPSNLNLISRFQKRQSLQLESRFVLVTLFNSQCTQGQQIGI